MNLSAVDVLLAEVGAIEDHVFQMRHENEEREKARRGRFQKGRPPPKAPPKPTTQGKAARILAKGGDDPQKLGKNKRIQVSHKSPTANATAAKELQAALSSSATSPEKKRPIDEVAPDGEDDVEMKTEDDQPEKKPLTNKDMSVVGDIEEEFDVDDDEDDVAVSPKVVEIVDPEAAKRFKEKVKDAQQKKLDDYAKNVEDKVRLHEQGWRDRYYTDKCKADDVENHGGREHLFRSYIQGLIWVMKYYYVGCPSWKWYYPFHYAPFASDLRNIERFSNDCKSFELNTPFNPVEQLMAVLPSDSSHAVPQAARWLMCDEESPILDFYPKDVPVDPNGKAMPWLWVVLLPFIEEDRLFSAFHPTMDKWTKEELLCNARGLDDGYLYIHRTNSLSEKFGPILQDEKQAAARKVKLSNLGSQGFSGLVRPPLDHEVYPLDDDTSIEPPPGAEVIDDPHSIFGDKIENNSAVCVAFSEPRKLSHKSALLPGAAPQKEVLGQADKIIRRPRLNRGGGTISNLGVASQSHRPGYGSMNISSYERDLAHRTGRGAEMYQPGTRAWGAMEPAPKRRNIQQNPFSNQHYNAPRPQNGGGWDMQQGGRPQPHRNGQGGHYQNSQYHRNHNGHQPPAYQQQPNRNHQHPPHYHNQPGPRYQQNGPPRHHQNQRQGHNGHQGYQGQRHDNRSGGQHQGYDFRGHNNHGRGGGRPRANEDVINNLRAQLSSTLNRNRGGNHQDSRRR